MGRESLLNHFNLLKMTSGINFLFAIFTLRWYCTGWPDRMVIIPCPFRIVQQALCINGRCGPMPFLRITHLKGMWVWVHGCGHGCKSESQTSLLLFYIYVVAQLLSVIQQSPWSPSMCSSQMVWPNLNYWVECLNWWITPPPLDPNHRAYARKWKIVYLLWPTSSTGSPSQQNNHDVLKRWNFFLSNKI